MTLDTQAGPLTIDRATSVDFDSVMAILREAADWLTARGNPQWQHWYMDFGERILRDRLEHHEVYLFRLDTAPVGTLTIQWSDSDVWGERGIDGLAGYIHGIAITRKVGGMGVGERMLKWAIDAIGGRGRRFARLDAMASNEQLCRYYEERGFRRLGTASVPGNVATQLFERELRREE
ncbi:MAG: GNAT family N-acetyltransferase [Candidatus Binataceae bacterium]